MSNIECFQACKFIDGLPELDLLQELIRLESQFDRNVKREIRISDFARVLGIKRRSYLSAIRKAVDGLRAATCKIDNKIYRLYSYIDIHAGKILYEHNKDLDDYFLNLSRDFCKYTRYILRIKKFRVLRFVQYLLAKSAHFTFPQFSMYIGSFRERFYPDTRFYRFKKYVIDPALKHLASFFGETYSCVYKDKCLTLTKIKEKADQVNPDQLSLNFLTINNNKTSMDNQSNTSIPNALPPVNSSHNKDDSLDLRAKDSKDLEVKTQVDSSRLVQAPAMLRAPKIIDVTIDRITGLIPARLTFSAPVFDKIKKEKTAIKNNKNNEKS